MGNADAGRLTAGFWGGNPLQLGAVGGKESGALTAVNQLPSHQHGVFLKDQHTHPFTAVLTVSAQNAAGSPAFNIPNTPTSGTTGQNAAGSITVGSVNGVANDNLTAAQGQATPAAFAAIGPRKLCTFYMKL
jgi:microcystin-dependent protein